MLSDCDRTLLHWPIGEGKGELLAHPVIDNTPVRCRGVLSSWVLAAVDLHRLVPTRVLVEAFVKPFTGKDVCALYFFVPLQFRAKATAFVSHAWNGLYSHVQAAAKTQPNAALWLDILAITQHPGNAVEVQEIGSVVKDIGSTLLCMPGCGDPYEALCPITRSWCIFEIVFTPEGALKVVIGTDNWKEYRHQQNGESIARLSVAEASAFMASDKADIDKLVLGRFASFEEANAMLRSSIMQAFHSHFASMGERKVKRNGTHFRDFAKYYILDASN
jgi:hypothetical protein